MRDVPPSATADSWETPSKSTGRGPLDSSVLLPLTGRTRIVSHSHSQSLSVVATSSHLIQSDHHSVNSSITQPTTQRGRRQNTGEQTFLTECSFAVTQDKLVQAITQVQPYEPHWENLPEIDLSGRGVESVARMKEFFALSGDAQSVSIELSTRAI